MTRTFQNLRLRPVGAFLCESMLNISGVIILLSSFESLRVKQMLQLRLKFQVLREVSRRSAEGQPEVSQRSAGGQPKVSRRSTKGQPEVSQRSAGGQPKVSRRSAEGQPKVSRRSAEGQPEVSQRSAGGQPKVSQRSAGGLKSRQSNKVEKLAAPAASC
ncbi:nipped-B-like protein [Gambusia affinis]|uniref:nipped-B-like protein n=1 Tax=Gambusia affinis TaxID=33528 RepID=UPI001CDB6360|nr:nipped-B-like protein [Gambusia affinis]